MIVLVIGIVVFGLVLGALARFAVPGPDPMPLWLTALVGIVGSVAGGLAARVFLGSSGSLLFAFLGSVAVVVAYRRFVQHRGITGPEAHASPKRGVGVRSPESRHARMLEELREAGVLTPGEYEAKRRSLERGT